MKYCIFGKKGILEFIDKGKILKWFSISFYVSDRNLHNKKEGMFLAYFCQIYG